MKIDVDESILLVVEWTYRQVNVIYRKPEFSTSLKFRNVDESNLATKFMTICMDDV